jgi:hypothetical protein
MYRYVIDTAVCATNFEEYSTSSRILSYILKGITSDPDPDPALKMNADPCGSESG